MEGVLKMNEFVETTKLNIVIFYKEQFDESFNLLKCLLRSE